MSYPKIRGRERDWCAHFNKTAQSWGNDESARMQISSHKTSYDGSIDHRDLDSTHHIILAC